MCMYRNLFMHSHQYLSLAKKKKVLKYRELYVSLNTSLTYSATLSSERVFPTLQMIWCWFSVLCSAQPAGWFSCSIMSLPVSWLSCEHLPRTGSLRSHCSSLWLFLLSKSDMLQPRRLSRASWNLQHVWVSLFIRFSWNTELGEES